VVGHYAYVADGLGGLRVLDVSDAAHPTEVGVCDTPGSALGVALKDNYAYLADADQGLRIIAVSDPSHPTEISFSPMPGIASDVAVMSRYAYVASAGEGLRVVNISDPAHPTEAGLYETAGTARGVTGSVGGYACVADDEGGLVILRPMPKAVTADFAAPLAGLAPLTVTFANQSTGVYTASLWSFGDGATGTLTNPTHTFTSVGAYTVTLTVSGPEDTDTAIKPAFIAVVEPRVYLPIVMRDQAPTIIRWVVSTF